MKIFVGFLFLFLSFQAFLCGGGNGLVVNSPDGRLKVSITLEKGQVFYMVNRDNQDIIEKSRMGFQFRNIAALDGNFIITNTESSTFNQTWEQPWGEKRYITNHYNQLVVHLREKKNLQRKLDIIFRVFDDGLGFRYVFPQQDNLDSLVISDEMTEFNMPPGNTAWWIPVHRDNSYYESIYHHTPMSRIDTANTPITIETKSGLYLVIHEAGLTDYASMTLLRTDSSRFKCELVPWSNGVKVYGKAPFFTPWRTIIVADKPGDLITSYVMLNLNEPCKLDDISWIKPAKYIGIWWGMHMNKYTWSQGPKHGATTANTLCYIDFAALNGFKGVLVEGWNQGWDGDWTKNGDKFSFTKPYPDFDIERICSYAASKNVELIGHNETAGAVSNYESQLDDAFAMYHRLCVGVVKTGYVNKYLDGKEWHDGQFGVRHYRRVIETAAKYHIMIDNHEPVKPTGLCRTYPNFMTQEGARGQEYDAWSADGGNPPSHTTILPFTRMLAGPFDFTPGTFNFTNTARPGTRVQTTLAKQLALYVVIYSPLQMASDLPENYAGNPAFEFIKAVPCDWEDTKVLNGQIGDYVTIARKDRNSDNWYLGSITDENARNMNLTFSFLDPGKKYQAHIFSDGKGADWKTNPLPVDITTQEVDNTTSMDVWLAAGGGLAIEFVPENK